MAAELVQAGILAARKKITGHPPLNHVRFEFSVDVHLADGLEESIYNKPVVVAWKRGRKKGQTKAVEPVEDSAIWNDTFKFQTNLIFAGGYDPWVPKQLKLSIKPEKGRKVISRCSVELSEHAKNETKKGERLMFELPNEEVGVLKVTVTTKCIEQERLHDLKNGVKPQATYDTKNEHSEDDESEESEDDREQAQEKKHVNFKEVTLADVRQISASNLGRKPTSVGEDGRPLAKLDTAEVDEHDEDEEVGDNETTDDGGSREHSRSGSVQSNGSDELVNDFYKPGQSSLAASGPGRMSTKQALNRGESFDEAKANSIFDAMLSNEAPPITPSGPPLSVVGAAKPLSRDPSPLLNMDSDSDESVGSMVFKRTDEERGGRTDAEQPVAREPAKSFLFEDSDDDDLLMDNTVSTLNTTDRGVSAPSSNVKNYIDDSFGMLSTPSMDTAAAPKHVPKHESDSDMEPPKVEQTTQVRKSFRRNLSVDLGSSGVPAGWSGDYGVDKEKQNPKGGHRHTMSMVVTKSPSMEPEPEQTNLPTARRSLDIGSNRDFFATFSNHKSGNTLDSMLNLEPSPALSSASRYSNQMNDGFKLNSSQEADEDENDKVSELGAGSASGDRRDSARRQSNGSGKSFAMFAKDLATPRVAPFETTDEYHTMKHESQELRIKLGEAEQRVEDLTREISAMSEEQSVSKGKNIELMQTKMLLAACYEQRDSYKAELDEAKAANVELTATIETMKNERLEDVNIVKDAHDEVANELHDRIKELEGELEMEKQYRRTVMSEMPDDASGALKTKSELSDVRAECDVLQEQISHLKDELVMVRGDKSRLLKQLEEEYPGIKEENATLQEEIDKITDELENAIREKMQADKLRDQEQAKFAEEKEDLMEKLKDLGGAAGHLDGEVSGLSRDELIEAVGTLQIRMAGLQQAKMRLKTWIRAEMRGMQSYMTIQMDEIAQRSFIEHKTLEKRRSGELGLSPRLSPKPAAKNAMSPLSTKVNIDQLLDEANPEIQKMIYELGGTKADLENEVTRLQKEIGKLKEEKRETVERLTEEVDLLNRMLADADARVSDALDRTSKSTDAEEKIKTLEGSLENARASLASSERALASLEKERDELALQRQQEEHELVKTKTELMDMQLQKEELEEELENVKEQFENSVGPGKKRGGGIFGWGKETDPTLDKVKAELEVARNRINELEREVERLREEKADVMEQMTLSVTELSDAKVELAKAVSDREDAEERLTNIKAGMEVHGSEVEKMQATLSSVRRELEEKTKVNHSMAMELSALKQENQKFHRKGSIRGL